MANNSTVFNVEAPVQEGKMSKRDDLIAKYAEEIKSILVKRRIWIC